MKFKILILLLMANSVISAQTWQWGKRGGSSDNLSASDQGFEQAYCVVSDSQKNIYLLSNVGKNELNVDGNTRQAYGDPMSITDVMLSSFACDGTFRWSKVIGGGGIERIYRIQVDDDDNIYVGGRLSSCDPIGQYPSRIDSDVILDQTNSACSLLFLAKYDTNGNLQWFRRPQPTVDSSISYSLSTVSGIATDSEGNTDLLLLIPPGTYANGDFTATEAGSHYYMFRYNSDGIFQQAIPIDIQHAINVGITLDMYINPNNGHYYFVGGKNFDEEVITIGGQNLDNGFFLSSFDENGQFLWMRQSSGPANAINSYNLAFDGQNNIYMGGYLAGFNLVSFLGFSTEAAATPPYIMKMNPNAENIIWVSHASNSADMRGGIVINEDEIALTNYAGGNYSWGNQSIAITVPNQNQGSRVLLARFDTTTGACEHLDFIPSDFAGQNRGTSITVDASGDYIIGGGFTGTQFYGANSTTSVGGQSDFFLTKYATSVCSPLKVDSLDETGLKFYPNPVKSILRLEIDSEMSYELIDQSGRGILKGSVSSKDAEINVSGVSSGAYILKLTDADGEVNTIRIIKE